MKNEIITTLEGSHNTKEQICNPYLYIAVGSGKFN